MTRDHVDINRDVWNADAENRVAAGERLWKAKTPIWGSWGVSDDTLMLLPEDLTGNDAILDAARDISRAGWRAL